MSHAAKIGKVANETGLSIDTIRFYEKQGLLKQAPRTEGGFRLFGAGDIETLKFVRKAQESGFSFNEIRELLILRADYVPACSHVREMMEQKLAAVEQKITELQSLKLSLAGALRKCKRELQMATPGHTARVNDRREGLPSREMLRQAIREENSGLGCGAEVLLVGREEWMDLISAASDGIAILESRVACDCEEFAVRSNGGDWLTAWHPPVEVPAGTPHGANGLCATDDGVVLISTDAKRWGWPGGRPEGSESWEQTLRREMLEEACCIVREARLLGFCRSRCLSGPQKGLVLVRSIWRAEVDLMPWEPRFEIAHRQVVPTDGLLSNLWMEDGFEPIYYRALREAALT